jgi:hypothetical protein
MKSTWLKISTVIAVVSIYTSETKGIDSLQPDPKELIKDAEVARIHYVTELTEIALKYMSIDKGPVWEKLQPGWVTLNAEILRNPAPIDSDTKALSKLMVGKWQSPRHAYIFSSDGLWRMAPESGTTNGHWRIDGNQYLDGNSHYSIILLNQNYFVFTDGETVFFEWRIK